VVEVIRILDTGSDGEYDGTSTHAERHNEESSARQ
jgi:hypothetical protein